MRYFTKEHEWMVVDGDVATIGITQFAADQLGDIVFVELPEIGRDVTQMGPMAVVESTKAASDVYAPVSGEIVEVNGLLVDAPEKVNGDPEAAGWFVKIKLSDPTELDSLLDHDAYQALLKTL